MYSRYLCVSTATNKRHFRASCANGNIYTALSPSGDGIIKTYLLYEEDFCTQNACWSKTDANGRRISAPADGAQDEERRHRG